jgi:hypothetical protein
VALKISGKHSRREDSKEKTMDIQDKDLKKYYQAFLSKNPPHKKACPDIDALIRSFSKEMSEHKKIQIIDHITTCGLCFQKFEAVRQILKGSKSLAERFEGVPLSEAEVKELKQKAQDRIHELEISYGSKPKLSFGKKVIASFRLKPALKYASAVATICIIVAVAIVLFKIPQSIKDETLRGTKKEIIQMISPRGQVDKFPLAFKWEALPGVKEYQIVLLDEELTRIWTSEKTENTEMLMPSTVQNELQKERTYYWKIVILLEDGIQNESDLQEFTLTENPEFPD